LKDKFCFPRYPISGTRRTAKSGKRSILFFSYVSHLR